MENYNKGNGNAKGNAKAQYYFDDSDEEFEMGQLNNKSDSFDDLFTSQHKLYQEKIENKDQKKSLF